MADQRLPENQRFMFGAPLRGEHRSMRLFDKVSVLERWAVLDPPSRALRKAADAALPSPAARDALHGVWLGHPLHPALIVLPLSSWLSAAVLDLLGGSERAARTLVGLGVVAAVPTAAAGAADFSRLHPEQQRVGVLHAGANSLTVALNAASWLARRRGQHRRAVALSLLALAAGSAGAYLGGHLSYRQAAGANHAEQVPHLLPDSFTPLCRLSELDEGHPVRMLLDVTPVLVLRRDGQVHVLADQCSHLAGPLHAGELGERGGALCLTCPWHGSTFRVDDGSVVHGPATAPQPVLEVQVDGTGMVLARTPRAS